MINNNYYITMLQNEMVKNISNAQESILKGIIAQITGREATIDDAKDLTKIYYQGEPLNYDIAYKGNTIGKMIFTFIGASYEVTFKPTQPSFIR